MQPGSEAISFAPCPVCGGSNHRVRWKCDGFSFVRCLDCRIIFQNPRPDQATLLDRYSDAYYEYERENEAQFFDLMKRSLIDISFENLTRDFQDERRTFLDIGCATGILIASLQSQGWRCKGVEVCEPAARFGREKRLVDVRHATLEQARFGSGGFGVVHCSHLIEHLTDPIAFIAECLRILADDGLLIVTTPNSAGFQARLFGARWRSAIADHMVLFSKSTLNKLLSDAGVEVIDVKTWGGIAKGAAPGFIKHPMDRMAKQFGFGDVMIMVGKRSVRNRRL